jgi:RNA polymerase sigma factor (sigma-70 family)
MTSGKCLKDDDLVLWDRIKQGNKRALAELYDRYIDALYNYAMKICKDKELAEDCIQDLFIEIWRYHGTLGAINSVRYYLYLSLRRRIVKGENKNLWLTRDSLHWEDLKGFLDTSLEDSWIDAEISDERTRKLHRYLHNLSPRQYEAIVLYFYEGFGYDEIANMMNLNSQSARNLIQRGLVQLRQHAQLLMSLIPGLCIFRAIV